MALSLEIWRTSAGAYTDYSAWLLSPDADPIVTRTHQLNDVQELQFVLADGLASFQVPEAGNRVRVITGTYPNFFTGYLTQTPKRELVGKAVGSNSPVYGYRCHALSEERRLEWQTELHFPTLPPFVNKYQGEIIKELISILGGGFTTTNVDNGILVPFFRVRPEEGFMDTVRRLSDRTNMKFWTSGGAAYYKTFDDSAFAPHPNETDPQFDPGALDIEPSQNPVFNDVVGLGGIESQAYVREYFLGDGISARFPLKFPLFGAESSKLLEDDFTGTAIDSSRWTETDPDALISVSANSLRFNGGPTSNNCRLTAKQGLEIAGVTELRAGRIRFGGATNAIIGGAFSADTGMLAQCVAGFRATPDGGQTQIQAIVSGSVAGPAFTTASGKTYQFVLTINCSEAVRRRRTFFSRANQFGGEDIAANAHLTFSVIELPDNESDAPVVKLSYTAAVAGIAQFLYYSIVAGPGNGTDSVNLTLNFSLLRKPIQVQLWTQRAPRFVGLNLDTWNAGVPAGWTTGGPSLSGGLSEETSIVVSGHAAKITGDGTTAVRGYIEQSASYLKPNRAYRVRVAMRKTSGMAAGVANVDLFSSSGGIDTTGVNVATSSLNTSYDDYEDDLTTGLASIPSDLVLRVFLDGTPTNGESVYVDEIRIREVPGQDRLGDKADPAARASIVVGAEGHELAFFKDAQPEPKEKIKIVYRAAGQARARVRRDSSVAAESAKSGDSGVRAGILPDVQPLPRDAVELERAIQAYVDDRTSPVYEGNWTYNTISYPPSAEPVPGRFITIDAPTRHAAFDALVTEVTSRFVNKPVGGNEIIEHDISFGTVSRLENVLDEIAPPEESLRGAFDTLVQQEIVEFADVGTAFAADRPDADFSGALTASTVEIDAGAAPDSAYEVRKTDAGWGKAQTLNDILSSDPTTQVFTVPRATRDLAVLLKNKDGAGLVSRYPSVIRLVYPLPPNPPTAAVDVVASQLKPVVQLSLPADAEDVWGVEIRDDDDATILYQYEDILLSITPDDPALKYVFDNSTAKLRTKTLYAYSYNLLGEYSSRTTVSISIPAPGVPTSLNAERGQGEFLFLWDIPSGYANPEKLAYDLEIASDTGFSADVEAFEDLRGLAITIHKPNLTRYWRVRAKDELGPGNYAAYGAPTAISSGLVNLDGDVSDGSTYTRVRASVQSDGRIRFLRTSGGSDLDVDDSAKRAYDVLNATSVKAGKLAGSAAGLITGGRTLAQGNTADTSGNWVVVATVDFDIGAAGSVLITLTQALINAGSGGGVGFASGTHLGASIHSGSPPASPQQSGTSGTEFTFSSPSGNKLSLYLKGAAASPGADAIQLTATQDTVSQLRTGKVSD